MPGRRTCGSSGPRPTRASGAAREPTRRLAFAPLFGHQYSHIFIDFRGIRDAPMRAAGLRLFREQPPRDLRQARLCAANPMRWHGYSDRIWGLTACDGPGDYELPFKGEQRTFFGYAARGPLGEPDERDDGTLAPTAALGSLPFAPEIVIPAAEALLADHGTRIFDDYGFLDSFNPSFTYTDVKLETGTGRCRSTAGSRPTISASTRGRSCCRRRTTATISSGGTCARSRRSGAA